MHMDGIIQFFTVLAIFVLVLVITLFVTKWIGQYQKIQSIGTNVQVVETCKISPSTYVEILKLGKKYIAVAVSKENTTYLCELDESDIDINSGSGSAMDFSGIFDKVKTNFTSRTPDDIKDE